MKSWLILLMILIFSSCKKEESCTPTTINYENYSGLKIGNYWVYYVDVFDENGGFVRDSTGNDSVSITGEKQFNGNTYFIQSHFSNGNLVYNNYLRDSLEYLVNPYGQIYYSSTNFTDILSSDFVVYGQDTVSKREFFMCENDKNFNVPAGNFKSITARRKLYVYPKVNGQHPIKNADMVYSKGVGLIFERIYYAPITNSCYERKLARYKVE